jgi:hypothetical protein
MMRRTSLAVMAALSLAQLGRADLTLRHSFEVKVASFVPAEIAAQVKQQFGSDVPSEALVRIKGNRVMSSFGPLAGITDYGRNQITLLNPKKKEYATLPLADYPDKLAAAIPKARKLTPENEEALAGLNFDVQSSRTGEAEVIQRMRAEESLMVISIQAPSPQGVPAVLQMEMRYWLARPEDIRRVPGLKELADYMAQSSHFFDPLQMMRKTFSGMSGLGERMREPLEELSKLNGSLVLKLQTAIRIPGIAQAIRLAQPPPAGFDANAPLLELEMDLAEVSTAPIDETTFAIPPDYHSAPVEELVNAIIQATPQISTIGPKR